MSPESLKRIEARLCVALGLACTVALSGCATGRGDATVLRNVGYHDDGTLRSVNHSYVSGSGKIVFHGTWIEWSRDGKKRFQRVYEHDSPHGRWVEWDNDGTLKEISTYQQGRPASLWTFWSGDAGVVYASWVRWDDKGRKQQERFYRAMATDEADQMWVRPEHLAASGGYKKGQPWDGHFVVRDGSGEPQGYIVEYSGGKRARQFPLDEYPPQ
ncbi:MAG: hypothetical protein O2923_09690 [Verrucomicrobia bacterium]|nr:hypothetical protein [Verrucomicrobiota bacterium]MDA1087445.1 hypothetical protein [Verrucomicrobiota bacterium]